MTHEEIKIGGRYTAKVSDRNVVVRVVEINSLEQQGKPSVIRYTCRIERTNGLITFRSAQRFRAELGRPINEIKWSKNESQESQVI